MAKEVCYSQAPLGFPFQSLASLSALTSKFQEGNCTAPSGRDPFGASGRDPFGASADSSLQTQVERASTSQRTKGS